MTLAHIDTPGGLARPGTFTEGEIETLKRTIAHDLTDDELNLFAAVCKRTGLDPFAKQIYAIKRTTRRKQRGQWVDEDVLTIQTGIDGIRLIAERSSLYAGQDPPEWCGPDGQWTDVWLSDQPPAAARVAVYRKDFARPVVGVAKFDSYADRWKPNDAQEKAGQLGDLRNLWKAMPEQMIAKCAEALALRKAFPNDLSGVYATEEMDQANNVRPIDTGAREGISERDFDEIREAAGALTDEQRGELHAWCEAEGIEVARARLTSDGAGRVLQRILDLARGAMDVPSGPATSAPSSPGSASEDGDRPPDAAAAVQGDGVPSSPASAGRDGAGGQAGARPAPSGAVTAGALLAATNEAQPGKAQLRVMRSAREVAQALSRPVPASIDVVVEDQAFAALVLHDLGGGAELPPVEHRPWKQVDEAEWTKWKNRCNAKAGPGTKAKPHPRLLDEDREIYDEQRHALAWQASHKHRGPGLEVESWSDVTEVEARAIEAALELLKAGEALLTFDEGGRWVCQRKAAA